MRLLVCNSESGLITGWREPYTDNFALLFIKAQLTMPDDEMWLFTAYPTKEFKTVFQPPVPMDEKKRLWFGLHWEEGQLNVMSFDYLPAGEKNYNTVEEYLQDKGEFTALYS